ncbi:DUF4141 domain-containing protein [Gilliamella sp. ESL0441]|uniref:DUF4141 domain-containing protein n=1 Tax=Gilliamella sp. ESL0441 TaxID=2704654 RepID=UPI001C69BB47|nr:DUF4141 domain-containing protein [Gilliamella sp. ESL0441]QYN45128.1 DUF4141 domain-containing protein [Gilliamella sp. ESL0441]
MKIKNFFNTFIVLVGLCNPFILHAQLVVSDPSNLIQSIINSTQEIVETSTTAQNMIKNFQETEKLFQETKKYYDQLKNVTDVVRGAHKIKLTYDLIKDISDIYSKNFKKMMNDKNYSIEELGAIATGYTNILSESSLLLDELQNVITVTNMSMTDKERLDLIDKIYYSMKKYRNLTQYYTNKNISISYLRSKKSGDSQRILNLYGKPEEKYW